MMVFIPVIAGRLNIVHSVAIPAAILCINRRLYMLASPITIIPSKADKNRELIIDLVIGIGLPITAIALSLSSNLSLYLVGLSIFSDSAFVTQTSRFQIVEDYGCNTSVLPSWITLVLMSTPSILLEFIAGIYGCLSIRAFYNRSKENKIHKYITPNRYIRLICFSTWDLLSGIPITMFFLYVYNRNLVPFSGLTQEQFSQIVVVPAVEWRATVENELSIELSRWLIVYAMFSFFAIFGFTEESRNNYRAMLQSVVQVFSKITGIKNRPITSTSTSTSTIDSTGTGRKAEGCVTHQYFIFSPSDILLCYLESRSTAPKPSRICSYYQSCNNLTTSSRKKVTEPYPIILSFGCHPEWPKCSNHA